MKKTYTFTYTLPLIIIVLFVSLSNPLNGQNASIRGFALEEETGEPVIFTNVYLYRTSYGSTTDESGYFNISNIPPGSYELMVTSIGYDTLRQDVSLAENQIMNLQLKLATAQVRLEGVKITARREESMNESKVSINRITPEKIKQLPTVGGQADIAQYLQVLPGVIFSGDQGGMLYVRGGPPIQSKVIIDGMTIYNPFHSIGLFSVFETDIIRNIDMYTGGFNSEFGGRISSIMDITTKDGNKRRISGKAALNTMNSGLLIEGPLAFKKEKNKNAHSSFILSVKNAHIKESSKVLYDYIDEDGLPYEYTDIYGKLSFYPSDMSRVNIYGFNYTDRVSNYKGLADYNWDSYGIGSNFIIIPASSQAKITGFLAYSEYQVNIDENFNPDRSSAISNINMGIDFKYFFGKDELHYGLDMIGGKTVYQFLNSENNVKETQDNTTELGIFFKYKKMFGRILIEPGLRFQHYASMSHLSIEPRFTAKYNMLDNLRFKFAAGKYSQNLVAAVSDRDIANLFYGFVSGVTNLPSEFKGEDIKNSVQKSQHFIAGIEYDFKDLFTVNVEGYFIKYPQLVNYNRDKIYEDTDEIAEFKPDIVKKTFIIEQGEAKGLEFFIKTERERYNFWIIYSYAFVDRFYETAEGDIESYNPYFDRRHNLNLVGSYLFGRGHSFAFSVRWNYGTGFPFTPTQLFYEQIPLSDGVNSSYLSPNGNMGFLYGNWNEKRLPTYHRLDISLKKTYHFGKYSKLEVDASIINVYNRQNIFYVDRNTNQRIDQLPFLPGLGVNFYF